MEILVAEKLSDECVVINKGTSDGISIGQRFLIFGYGKQITDPSTGEVLGKLEIVRGTGKVTHVQEKISTITSDMKKTGSRVIKKAQVNPISLTLSSFLTNPDVEEILPPTTAPFIGAQKGDTARPI